MVPESGRAHISNHVRLRGGLERPSSHLRLLAKLGQLLRPPQRRRSVSNKQSQAPQLSPPVSNAPLRAPRHGRTSSNGQFERPSKTSRARNWHSQVTNGFRTHLGATGVHEPAARSIAFRLAVEQGSSTLPPCSEMHQAFIWVSSDTRMERGEVVQGGGQA